MTRSHKTYCSRSYALLFALMLCLCPFMAFSEDYGLPYKEHAHGVKIAKLPIEIPEQYHIPVEGELSTVFPTGIPISLGSGLALKKTTKDSIELIGLSDRGPNLKGPLISLEGMLLPTISFLAPSYAPQFGTLLIKDGKAKVISTKELSTPSGDPLSGRPLPWGSTGSTKEVPITKNLQILPSDPYGVDSEGIAYNPLQPNIIWVADEYGPSILKIDYQTGKLLRRYSPGNGLPRSLDCRMPNRGFEGIAVTPENKVYAALQSVCFSSDKKVKAPFIRILELDPQTEKTRTFGYVISNQYNNKRNAKIGDLVAINNHEFILMEQGWLAQNKKHHTIYRIDISAATDLDAISPLPYNSLEDIDSFLTLKRMGIDFVSKKRIIDLEDYKWPAEKAEGLTLIDGRTFAVSSDNDFGLDSYILDQGLETKEFKSYVLENNVLYHQENLRRVSYHIKATGEKSQLWVIQIPDEEDSK